MKAALTVLFALHAAASALAAGLPFAIARLDRKRPWAGRPLAAVALVALSAAIVLGVGALLFVSRVHARRFTEAALAHFWPLLGVLPLLSIAYVALYLYQLKAWKPGPWAAGLSILAVAGVFAAVAAHEASPMALVRLLPFAAASAVAAGTAVLVRGEDPRWGARVAFGGALALLATGFGALTGLGRWPQGAVLWFPAGGAAALALVLGILSFSARVTRFSSICAAAGFVFVVLGGSAMREDIRTAAGRPKATGTATGRVFAMRVEGVPGLENLAQLAPGIYRGAQPDAEGLQSLRKLGVKTVINLRTLHSERREVDAAGMTPVEIPMAADVFGSRPPSQEDVRRFFEVVLDPAKRPVYFHCAHGKDRTGTMAALYRIGVDGWTPEEAIEEMRSFGYHEIYRDLIDFVRAYRR